MLALHCIVKQMRRRCRRITRTHGGLDGTVGNGEDLGDIKLDFSNSQLECQHFRRPVSKDEMIRTSAITLACDCSQEGKENERRVHLGWKNGGDVRRACQRPGGENEKKGTVSFISGFAFILAVTGWRPSSPTHCPGMVTCPRVSPNISQHFLVDCISTFPSSRHGSHILRRASSQEEIRSTRDCTSSED